MFVLYSPLYMSAAFIAKNYGLTLSDDYAIATKKEKLRLTFARRVLKNSPEKANNNANIEKNEIKI